MVILIKGAGDLATGVAYKLKMCGFDIIMTEVEKPTTVRRTVAFSQAVYEDTTEVEGIKAVLVNNKNEALNEMKNNNIAIIIDEKAKILEELKADVVIDAILAKKNLNTKINDANIVIALGPGFEAEVDCNCVIETKRGHYLGKPIYKGSAIANTGIPGNIGGYTIERIIRANDNGIIKPVVDIGDTVEKGQVVAYINERPVLAEISGIVRGILQEGTEVFKGMKSGDIDPRCEKSHCYTISDKARSIAGGVLEAILHLSKKY